MQTTNSKTFPGTFRPVGPCLNIALDACYLILVGILILFFSYSDGKSLSANTQLKLSEP